MKTIIELPELSLEHRNAIAKVFQAVGRSVVMYQGIESQLKMLLPNLVIDGAPEHDNYDQFEEMKLLLESKKTMGPLMERLRLSTKSSHPEGLEAYFHRVVTNRNELIHSFSKLSFGSLTTIEKCEQAISYLEERYKYAVPLRTMLRKLLESLVEILGDDEDEVLH